MLFKKISPDAFFFIANNLKELYVSDNHSELTYTNYEPYQLHDPLEFSGSDFYIYLRKIHVRQSYCFLTCAVEVFTETDPPESEVLDDPVHFIEMLMKWHPNTDVYGCEQRSNWHDRLQDELGCSTNTRPKRAKI